MSRIARRDRAAFAAFFRRYAGRVKAMLMRRGIAGDRAEDLAQEVMVQLWRRAETFDPARASAATWLYTIARNRLIDEARRAARRVIDPEEPTLDPGPEPGAERVVGERDRDAQVRAALDALPAAQRDVLYASFHGGLSQQEIAARDGVPLGTVKSRVRLAFARLRAQLGEDMREELTDD
ncbi:sigma-70 family RNA polymerase sigma factor [Roseobacter sp. HKCCA0434]|uniref:sigma-70 family RNA polymerase sigma factor n=1 Tax=Roseobacter sp. HKCCA0434 TaxID=3079297 RepID=UPI002905A033|nr:sigma-70 family RNA polymerase sigma factor [Roseobacter sp. HKCCA0434]